ncbi:hypothetical protein LINPERPRIM_LOCUS21230 [Linum perenne]
MFNCCNTTHLNGLINRAEECMVLSCGLVVGLFERTKKLALHGDKECDKLKNKGTMLLLLLLEEAL